MIGADPVAASRARVRGLVHTTIQLPSLEPRSTGPSAVRPATVWVDPDARGGVSRVDLECDLCSGIWQERSSVDAVVTAVASVSRREGKALDAIYSAACCSLLHEVGLAHYWDGQPHGPGRAWNLPHDGRISDQQRLVVRVALDMWDNQGGVLLRDLRKLPALPARQRAAMDFPLPGGPWNRVTGSARCGSAGRAPLPAPLTSSTPPSATPLTRRRPFPGCRPARRSNLLRR